MGACAATDLTPCDCPRTPCSSLSTRKGRSIRAVARPTRPRPREHRGACRRLAGRGSAAGPCRPAAARPSHAPPDGEILVAGDATSAFVGTALEARLDELGATTLVICGALATHALEASARHAADLGYQVFVVADACRPADALDLRWPALAG